MRVKISGRQLYFDVEGAGLVPDGDKMIEKPTLILLHGAPGLSDHTTFKPDFSCLADDMQLIYLDLAGCGRSDDIGEDEAYSLEGWADDIVAFCEALSIEKPFVLGVSGGGMVAQAYAIRHSAHCAGVIFANTQAYFDPASAVSVFQRLGGDEAAQVAEKFLTRETKLDEVTEFNTICRPLYNRTPPDKNRLPRMIMRDRVAIEFHNFGSGIWHRMDMRAQLSKVECPVLVMAGEDDPITPVADSDEIVARLNPALTRYEKLANCGHGNWLDQPEKSFASIREFVTQNL